MPVAWNSFAAPVALDDVTYGYKWTKDAVTAAGEKDGPLVTLPEYYRLERDEKGRVRWAAIKPKDVPAETGLAKVDFPKRRAADRRPYVTPDEANSCWKKPGPAAGPFEAKLGDGSVATYYWYRFADQPALAERRPDGGRAGERFRSGWSCCTRAGPRTASTCRRRRSANWPISIRRYL